MIRIFIITFALFALTSCTGNEDADLHTVSKEETANNQFKEYADGFIEDLWGEEPEWATQVGYHKYDSLLRLPDAKTIADKLDFITARLSALEAFDISLLSPSYQTDYHLIQNYLQSKKWNLEVAKEQEWNPSLYNVSGLIAFMLTENYAPLVDRLKFIHYRLSQIPAYYTEAKKQIKNPVPELQTLAIDQNRGGLSLLEKDLVDSIHKAQLPLELQQQMIAASKAAVKSIKEYINHLKNLKPEHPRSFRLGKDLYEQKFAFDIQSATTAAQLYEAAQSRKIYIHQEMAKLSNQLWSKYFHNQLRPEDTFTLIAKIIDTLSTQHVKPAAFQEAIEQQLPQLVQFIKDKNLLYIDPSKPLVVRKEPAYMAGVAGASISAPGPYDQGGNTYYNVGSLEGWPATKAESYLKEYNHYILQILNIHEAIPGHYTQLVYANRSPSLVKSILGNGAMIEGWAVYTEQMMLENGYGNNEPEMWLMWYKWNLRTVCNTLLDYNVHALDMTKEEAIHLLTHEAFQQQAEAEGKWKRVSVSSVQLTSYFSGYKEIIDLREALKQKEGTKFNLRLFHEKFLSYGSAPVKYISKLMLDNKEQ